MILISTVNATTTDLNYGCYWFAFEVAILLYISKYDIMAFTLVLQGDLIAYPDTEFCRWLLYFEIFSLIIGKEDWQKRCVCNTVDII